MHQDFYRMVQTATLGRWKAKTAGLSRGGDKNEELFLFAADQRWAVDVTKRPARGGRIHSSIILSLEES
jgi:hypothetical protein